MTRLTAVDIRKQGGEDQDMLKAQISSHKYSLCETLSSSPSIIAYNIFEFGVLDRHNNHIVVTAFKKIYLINLKMLTHPIKAHTNHIGFRF